MSQIVNRFEGKHFHVCCGLGGGAKGFNDARPVLGALALDWRCIGGVDNDPAGLADFALLTGVRGTLLDLFSREQYRAWHGHEPPADWRAAGPEDFHRAAGFERPNLVFTSSPCKGLSGLLGAAQAGSEKYQALNQLALRSIWLALEAWADDPPEFFLFENVPRIMTRGRALLDQIMSLMRHFGYAGAETRHDCGVIGGLAQSRKRFLGVFRHQAKVPPFLYEPPKRALRGVGEVLGRLPLPGDVEAGGPMHRMPALQWKTWVRLAFVEAGSDWRSLNRLRVEGAVLADYGIAPAGGWRGGSLGVLDWAEPSGVITSQRAPGQGHFSVADPREFERRADYLGVKDWDQHSGTVSSRGGPTNGAYAVADPRARQANQTYEQYGVRGWGQTSRTVTGQSTPGGGAHSISDPRLASGARYSHVYQIVDWSQKAPSVTGANAGTAAAVADPRAPYGRHVNGKWRVTGYDEPANCVIAASTTGNGAAVVADPRPVGLCKPGREGKHVDHYGVLDWSDHSGTITGNAHGWDNGRFSIADPRPGCLQGRGPNDYGNGGHYGVVRYGEACGAVTGAAKHDNGFWSVADERAACVADDGPGGLPEPADRLVAVIRALDGTWHRPFTTLELAALQSLFDPEDLLERPFELDGRSDSAWRERIGNAVPSAAARAIAEVMGRTLLMAWTGQSYALSSEPVWVQPLAIALSVDTEGAVI